MGHSKRPQTYEVYDPNFRSVLTIPRDFIVHLPPSSFNISRLVLCRNYTEFDHCAKAHNCKFVHADISHKDVKIAPIHVNYAWRSEDLCTYPRLEAGATIRVLEPNGRPPTELIPSNRLLVTRGAMAAMENPGQASSHCAHYHYNRICNRGETCSFIHCVHVDPTASDLQKAPAPNSMTHHEFPIEDAATEQPASTKPAEPAPEVDTSIEESEVSKNTCVVHKFRHDPYSFFTSQVILMA
jgi:hypothetical protein